MEGDGAPKVDVLACAKCGAPVALGDADLARCKNCGADTPIPEAHRKLRDLRRKDAELRARADKIFDELDSPPSLFVGVLAQTFDLGMFAFLIVYGIPLMLAAIFGSMFIVGAVAVHFGATVDDVPFPIVVLVAAFLVMVMTFVPRALGVYANRRASARAALVTALAAKSPTVEGGLTTCRECVAPLDIPFDVRVVHCAYCDAFNAVRIRTKLLAQTSSIVGTLGSSIESAAHRDIAERQRTRAQLWSELRRYAFRTATLGGVLAFANMHSEDGQPPVIGIIANFIGVFLLIFYIARSASAAPDDDIATRRSGNPAPEWVRFVGPIAFYGVLYLASFAMSLFALATS